MRLAVSVMFKEEGGLYALSTMAENTTSPDHDQKLLKANIVTLIGTNVLQGTGWGIFYTIYQGFILEYVKSEATLGIIVGLCFLLQFLPMPLFGMLSDKFGRKGFILSGMLIPITGLLLMGLSNDFRVILIGMGLFFFAWGIRDPAFQSATNENVVGKRSGLIFAIAAFGFFGGNLLASFIIARTSDIIPLPIYFLIFGGLYFIQFIWILLFYKELPKVNKDPIKFAELKEDLWKTWKEAFGNPAQRSIFIFFLFDGLIWGVGMMLFNGALNTKLNIGYDKLALILMGYNMALLATQIPVGKLIDRIGTKIAILFAEGFGVIFFLITIWAAFLEGNWQFWMLIVGQVLYGVALAFYFPAQLVLFTNSKKDKAAETYGIGSLMVGLSTLPATIIAGFLIERIHFIAPLVFAAILLPINTLIMYRKYSEKPKTESK